MADLERFTPDHSGQIAYEHVHRYAMCREYVAGLRVLDVASGEGYGSALLAQAALHVTGVDLDGTAVAGARAKYGRDGRLEFRQGDCLNLPFSDGSFDVVVSFETLEHVPTPERFVAEARRVLKPDGLLIVSTPNRDIYNRFKTPNPFHQRELSEPEFLDLLKAAFPHVTLLGQRLSLLSTIGPAADARANDASYAGFVGRTHRKSKRIEVEPGVFSPEEPEYMIALCSADEVPNRLSAHSVYISETDDLWPEHAKVMAWASRLHEEDETLRARVQQVQADLHAAELRAQTLDTARQQLEAELTGTHQIEKLRDEQLTDLRAINDRLLHANADLQAGHTDLLARLDKAGASTADTGEAAIGHALGLVAPMLAQLSGNAVQADLPSFLSALTQATVTAATSRLELAAKDAALAHAERQTAELRASLQEQRMETSRVAAALTEHQDQARQAATEAAALTAEQARQAGQLEELSAQRRDAQNRAAALETELAALRTALAAAQQERDHLSGLRSDLAQRMIAVQAERDRLLAVQAEQAARLNEAVGKAQAERGDAAQRLHAQETALRAEMNGLAKRLHDAETGLAMTGQARDEALACLHAETTARSAADNALAVAHDTLAAGDADRARLSDTVTALESRNADREAEWQQLLDTALTEAANHALRSAEELTVLRQELDAASAERTSLQQQNESWDREHAALAQQLAAVSGQLLAAERAAAHGRQTATDLTDYKNRLAAAQSRLAAQAQREHILDQRNKLLREREAVQAKLRQAAKAVRGALGLPKPAILRTKFRLLAEDLAALRDSGLFDAEWYAGQHNVPQADALDHFRKTGLAAGFDPHPLFHSRWFAQAHMAADDATPPILAYLRADDRSTLSPHPLFHPATYLAIYPDVADAGIDPFQHYLLYGEADQLSFHPLVLREAMAETGLPFTIRAILHAPDRFGHAPHPLFASAYYLDSNPDVAAAGEHPLLHYLVDGWRQARSPSPYFSNDWYLAENTDVLAAGINPLMHYVLDGWREHRNPNPVFQTMAYLATNGDVQKNGNEPLAHYLQYGVAERRAPSPTVSFELLAGLTEAETRAAPDPLTLLLRDDDLFAAAPPAALPVLTHGAQEIWPPKPRNDYWLPQALRDHIGDTFPGADLPEYSYLMSVIELYAAAPEHFDDSADMHLLQARARHLSQQRHTETPDVSIIIPVYNNLLYTLTSIVSLLSQAGARSFEILVGDDGSKDCTAQVMREIGGAVRHVAHPKNLGFLGNCNATAQHARGEYVLLLNNDTIILPNWLDALIGTFDDPNVGLAGSKLINCDGTLQEAGGIIWKDGSGWNFGLGQNASRPEFNYMKDVDYCSGASIALPTALWRDLQGFDPHFAPAYCEDTDLAMRVRAAGKRVVYQPFSELIHHEGRSHGRDVTSGIKAYQVVNQRKMLDRWGAVWAQENFPNAEHVFLARDRSRSKPHILIVDHYVPQWDQDAGSRTVFHYVRMFVEQGFQVTFWPDNLHRDPAYTPALQKLGVEVIYSAAYDGQFESWMQRNGSDLDYVLLNRPHISIKYIDHIRPHSAARVLYYGHDLHFKRLETERALTGHAGLDDGIAHFRELELYLAKQSDVVLYPSGEEIEAIRAELGPHIAGQAIPMNIFQPHEIARVSASQAQFWADRDPFTLLFVGGFGHCPNTDALLWFAQSVMPLLVMQDSRYHLLVAGSKPPAEVLALAGRDIEVLGRVTDEHLLALYQRAGVAVAPLRFGGGVKGKVIEALARATPIVTTEFGAQGIPAAERLMLLADTAMDFAQAVIAVGSNQPAAFARVRAGLAFIAQDYGLAGAQDCLATHIPDLARLNRQDHPETAGHSADAEPVSAE